MQGMGMGLGFRVLLAAATVRIGDQLQCGEEAFELMRGKCAHDEIALRAPGLSLN
jgi:hypothetical protein